MSNRKIQSMFVVVRQHERMNRGDSRPTTSEAVNYYVGVQRYWEDTTDPANPTNEAGQCIMLAHVGCGVKALTFVNGIVDEANTANLSPGKVQERCWDYIESLHAANKPNRKQVKRMSEEFEEQGRAVATAEPTHHHDARDASPTDATQDINDAIQGG